ncbi:hypothetical protein N7495_000288 [Penicillium taxi]|uniref:uncharacterized protein n=1 Tax=Penicillium taxi TaxID=168475 RepID=UPI00254560FD|nr:uncharacterized protein N7495_000288 [Penicillium taxi]KAJ5907606.1 hypothetical protein N7495_000288 [Penicillium taxi]
MTGQNWDTLFKSDSFVNQYKTGGKITGQYALSLIEQSNIIANSKLNPNQPLVVLDNACGTGVVSSILHHELGDKVKKNWKLTCGDISPGMIESTRRRAEEEQWSNATTQVLDAQKMSLPTAHFTHAFTAFAFMAMPQPLEALDEACRVLQPGGTIAFSTWIQPGWISIVGNAVKMMPNELPWPTPQEFLHVTQKGEWDSMAWIESQLHQRKFQNIDVRAVSKSISLKVPELSAMTMVMIPLVFQHFWSEKQLEETREDFSGALEKYLTDTYGKEGEVAMEWVAILSTACKPSTS